MTQLFSLKNQTGSETVLFLSTAFYLNEVLKVDSVLPHMFLCSQKRLSVFDKSAALIASKHLSF